MKRNICIALCAFLLAAPATASALDWEIKDVTHTITAKAGENSFMADGEEIELPEGTEVYKKDGYIMLPVEPLLDYFGKSRKAIWLWDEDAEECLTALEQQKIFVFDAGKNEMQLNGNKLKLAGTLEVREGEMFLPLRDWKTILEQYGHIVEGITWDSGTQTAEMRTNVQELDYEWKDEPLIPAGEGAAPDYLVEPMREYIDIRSFGDGYFLAMTNADTPEFVLINGSGQAVKNFDFGIRMEYLGEDCFLVSDWHGKQGRKIMDGNGSTLFWLEPNAADIGKFSEGLSAVRFPQGVGFLDKNGTLAIPAKFADADIFSEGLAAVALLETDEKGKQSEKWGYIDKAGNFAIDAAYESAELFYEGMAAVKTGGKWGYIDKAGRVVVPPQFDAAYQFYNGSAFALEDGEAGNVKLWLVSGTGEKPRQIAAGRNLNIFHAPRGRYKGVLCGLEEVNYRGGGAQLPFFFDADGEIPNERARWMDVARPNEAPFVFRDKDTGKYGYIDEAGNWLIAPVFERAEGFVDGYAVVNVEMDNGMLAYGIIKKP